MTEPRIIPPEEARALAEQAIPAPWHINTDDELEGGACGAITGPLRSSENGRYFVLPVVADDVDDEGTLRLIAAAPDLAHTAAVLGEENAALREQLSEQAAALARVQRVCDWEVAHNGATLAVERLSCALTGTDDDLARVLESLVALAERPKLEPAYCQHEGSCKIQTNLYGQEVCVAGEQP